MQGIVCDTVCQTQCTYLGQQIDSCKKGQIIHKTTISDVLQPISRYNAFFHAFTYNPICSCVKSQLSSHQFCVNKLVCNAISTLLCHVLLLTLIEWSYTIVYGQSEWPHSYSGCTSQTGS